MSETRQQLVQALNDAYAHEQALVPVLESQIAMAPRGRYRKALVAHVDATRDHARRIEERRIALHKRDNVFVAGIRMLENAVEQSLALGRMPLDLLDRPLERLRGSGGPDKVLSDAKTACATAAFEIAAYTGIETLAESIGDRKTAKVAASIRAEEQHLLESLIAELPGLVGWAADAAARGRPATAIAANSAPKARKPRKKAAPAKRSQAKRGQAKRSAKEAAPVATPAEDRAPIAQEAPVASPWAAPAAPLAVPEPETITVAKLTGGPTAEPDNGGGARTPPGPERADRITGSAAQEPANT
jgi:ferritin-like metal-binding protein YciE